MSFLLLENLVKEFVGRGGEKLLAALARFPVSCEGLIAADIGASTGGFTDCLLQHGAARVYAVDVGYGQLAWKLRQDARVVVMERTNARYLEVLPEPVDLLVSFDDREGHLRVLVFECLDRCIDCLFSEGGHLQQIGI